MSGFWVTGVDRVWVLPVERSIEVLQEAEQVEGKWPHSSSTQVSIYWPIQSCAKVLWAVVPPKNSPKSKQIHWGPLWKEFPKNKIGKNQSTPKTISSQSFIKSYEDLEGSIFLDLHWVHLATIHSSSLNRHPCCWNCCFPFAQLEGAIRMKPPVKRWDQ